MVKNISSVSVANYYNTQIKKQNNVKHSNEAKANSEQSMDTVSFKANPTTKVVEAATKSNVIKAFFITLAGLIGLGSVKATSKNSAALLREYRVKYPKLMEYLDNARYYTGRDDNVPHDYYTDVAKVAIVKTYEKDPEKALRLSEQLKRDCSNSFSQELLDEIDSNYEELSKYNSNNLEDAYARLSLVRKNPNLENIAQISSANIDTLRAFDNYCVDEESKTRLEKVLDSSMYINNSPEYYMEIADFCKQYPDMPRDVVRCLYDYGINDNSRAVIKKYANNWNKLAEDYKKYGSKAVMEMNEYLSEPKYIDFVFKYNKNFSSKDFINKINMAVTFFKELSSQNPESSEVKSFNKLFYEGGRMETSYRSLKTTDEKVIDFVRNIDADKAKLYHRMMKDGRCKNFSDIEYWLELYKKYPDTEITDEMVARYNDPGARAMDLY